MRTVQQLLNLLVSVQVPFCMQRLSSVYLFCMATCKDSQCPDAKQSVPVQTATAGRRHLMAVGNGQPGVQVNMQIPTTASNSSTQSSAIQNAINNGALASQWGTLGRALQSFYHICRSWQNIPHPLLLCYDVTGLVWLQTLTCSSTYLAGAAEPV